jgi:hypothetical protein
VTCDFYWKNICCPNKTIKRALGKSSFGWC